MSVEDGSYTGGGVTFEHRGLAQFTRRIQLILGTLPPEIGKALYELAQEMKTDSQTEWVPVRDGILRGSAFVDEPVVETAQISVRLGYGGAAEAYALAQHEDLTFHHPGLDNPGGQVGYAKYLERPVLAKANMIPERVGPIVTKVYHEAANG